MTRTMGVALGALLLALGCSTSSKASKAGTFDESRVAGIPADQKQEVVEARSNLDESKTDLDAAKRSKVESENRIRLAEGERNLAKTEMDQAKREAQMSVKRGEIASADDSPKFKQARLTHEAAGAKIDYLKSLDKYEGAKVKQAEKMIDLRKAEVDAAGFATLQRVDPKQVSSMGARASDFDARVAKAKAEVAKTDASVASHRAEAVPLYESWKDLDRQIGAGGRRASAPPAPPTAN